eukprot:TRINITY_DN74184_c0_g1_i1.p1 TRINITY_DN74184_c0_g1~~TRINITY_DN74184_c0_g1_i1.p1  ORF type:complete len:204 (-),score=33.94 TRINITY_DN74184_c0_g1_i1:119-730(-)
MAAVAMAEAGKRRVVDSEGPTLELLRTFGIKNAKGYYDGKIRGKYMRFDSQKVASAPADARSQPGSGRHKDAQGKEHWKNLRYSDFQPLRELWLSYIKDLLPGDGQELAATLANADLHGSTLEVVQAKNPGCVRLKGTVIEETQRTFRIITPDSRVRVLPKENSTFEVEVLGQRVRLLGPAWMHRFSAVSGAPGPFCPRSWSL